VNGVRPSQTFEDGRVRYDVKAKRDSLAVDFVPTDEIVAQDVWLTGPATYIAQILVEID
jgi:hypothetical protein